MQRGRLRSDLRSSIVDGMAFGGMVGFGETYLPAFALAVGLGDIVAGMVGSVPMVAGGLMQLISPLAVRALGSHRSWVILCAVLQGLIFLPLVLAAYWGAIDAWALLLIAAFYWGSGLATGPAWNTWIGTLVRPLVRARFFAHRTRLAQAATLLGVLGGGFFLHYAASEQWGVQAFALLFAVACGCRLLSAVMLAKHSEQVPMPNNMRRIPWNRVFHHLRASDGGKLLVYLTGVQATAQISGPFFTPFMLKQAEFSYAQFVTLLSCAFLAKVLALPFWGKVAKQTGARNLLWIGGLGIVPMSAIWVVSQNFLWLCSVQLLSGILWAAYELAFFLLFFESIPEDERTSVLTIYNLLNTGAMVVGAFVGAMLLTALGTTYASYLGVFLISSLARVLTIFLLYRVPKIVVDAGPVDVRTVAVRLGTASMDAPVLSSLPDRLEEHPPTSME